MARVASSGGHVSTPTVLAHGGRTPVVPYLQIHRSRGQIRKYRMKKRRIRKKILSEGSEQRRGRVGRAPVGKEKKTRRKREKKEWIGLGQLEFGLNLVFGILFNTNIKIIYP